jgi:hypothetical protein
MMTIFFFTSKGKLPAGYFSLRFRLSGPGSLSHLTLLLVDYRPATSSLSARRQRDSYETWLGGAEL